MPKLEDTLKNKRVRKSLGAVVGIAKKRGDGDGDADDFKFTPVPGHKGAAVVRNPSDDHHFHVIHPYGNDVMDLHHEGDDVYRHSYTTVRAKNHVEAAGKVLASRKADYDRHAGQRAAAEHERKHGNEYTGDISGLHEHMHVHRVEHNFVSGRTKDGDHEVHLKVYSEPSDYGIGHGRVSLMRVGSSGEHVNYDRGWDVRPKTPEHKALVRNINRSLGGKMEKGAGGEELWERVEAPALTDPMAKGDEGGERDDPPALAKAASNGHKVPGLSGWSMHAGGTGAAPGKHGYTHTAPGGVLNSGGENYMTYSVDPISNDHGRHLGYRASVAGHPNNNGLHNQITEGGQHNGHFAGRLFSSPQGAVKAARDHYNMHAQPNAPGCENCATSRRSDLPAT